MTATAFCCRSPSPSSRLFQKGDRVFLYGGTAVVEEDQLPGQDQVQVRVWAPCCVASGDELVRALKGTVWPYAAAELQLLPPLPPEQPVSEPEVAPAEAEGPPAEPPVPGPVQGTLPFSNGDIPRRGDGGAS